MLGALGSVLGIDVGYSTTKRSSAVCRLDWDTKKVTWTIDRYRAIEHERHEIISRVAEGRNLYAAAFDGPLRSGFDQIENYRLAERLLTGRLAPQIGKPGPSNSPVGKKLNEEANKCVRQVLASAHVASASHASRIDSRAIVEAFPSSFLGLMIDNPTSLRTRRGNRSDVYFDALAHNGTFERLLDYLLPDRTIDDASAVTNHDCRAALVCAFTALAVAANKYCAVGDADGWIILPPRHFICDWAWTLLIQNAAKEVGKPLYEA
jgi:hypothetical protein